MSNHLFSDEQLIAYALGESDPSEAERIARHIAECAQCRAVMANVESIRAALRPDGYAVVPSATLDRAQAIFRQHASVSQAPSLAGFRHRWFQSARRLAAASVLATILLALVLLYGSAQVVASAVQETLPGDALYPVKTTMEDVGAAVALDDSSKVQVQLAIAQARVTEINALVTQRRYDLLPATTHDYQEHVQKATTTLGQVLKQDPQQVPLAQKAEQDLSRYQTSLSQLQENSPRDIEPQIQQAVVASSAAKATVQNQLSDIANPSSTAPMPLLSPTPNMPVTGPGTPGPSVVPSTPAPAPTIVNTPTGAPTVIFIVPITPTVPTSTAAPTNTIVPASPTALPTGITATPSMTATATATIQPPTTTPGPTTPAPSSTPTPTNTLGSLSPTPSATAAISTPTATPVPPSPTPSAGTSLTPTMSATPILAAPTSASSTTILSGAQSPTPTLVPSPTSVLPRPTATPTVTPTATLSHSSTTTSSTATVAAASPTWRSTPTQTATKSTPVTPTSSSSGGPTNTPSAGTPNTSSEPIAPFGSLGIDGSRSMVADLDAQPQLRTKTANSNAEESTPRVRRVSNKTDRRIDNTPDMDRDVPRSDSSLLPPIVFGSISFIASLGIIIRTR